MPQDAPPDGSARIWPGRVVVAGSGGAGQPSPSGGGDRGRWHMLGRALIVLGQLFPEAPERPRAHVAPAARRLVVDFATVAVNVAVIALGAAVLLIRQAGHPSWDTIWAEDGHVFLPRALLHPVGSLYQPSAGYLQLPQQLIADVVARLPLGDAAAGLAVAGAVVASCCAAFVFHASAGHVRTLGLRVLLGASVVLLPTAVIEIANTSVNSSWYLLFALFWALIWRPRSWAGMGIASIIGFAAVSSQALAVLYAPLVAARIIALPRPREQAAALGWLAGLGLQASIVLRSHLPRPAGLLSAAFNYYFHHVVVAAVTGWHLAHRFHAESGSGRVVVAAACAVAALAGWALIRGDTRLRLLAAATLLAGILLAVVPVLSRSWVATSLVTNRWLPGSRYTDTPILLIVSLAIVVADAWLRSRENAFWHAIHYAGISMIVIILATTWVADFRYVNLRTVGPEWPQAVSRFDDACRQRPAAATEPLFYWESRPYNLPLPCSVAYHPQPAGVTHLLRTAHSHRRRAGEPSRPIRHHPS